MHASNKTILGVLAVGLLLTGGTVYAANASAQAAPAASTAAAAPAPAPAAAPAAPAAATASVGQAQFTTAVTNREPTDKITSLDNSHDKIFFYTALKGASGQTITHRWEYNGNTVAEVKFEPKANHWRVWSSKTLVPAMTGTWTVEVLDGSGNVLGKYSFDYTKAAATPAPAASTGTGH